MKTVFKFIHPIFPVSVGLFVVAAILLQGAGGPCASPIILLYAPIELGIVIGFALSIVRTIRFIRQKKESRSSDD